MAYDPNFLDNFEVPYPQLLPSVRAQAWNGGTPADYRHHSIVFNQNRGFAIYAAHNTLGASIAGIERKGFIYDRDPARIPLDLQVGDKQGYYDNPWDKGHLARSKALHWPADPANDHPEARDAERDGALYPNAFPQHHSMNQGDWARVEDWILDYATAPANPRRMCVFTGPVFSEADPTIINQPGRDPIRIPAGVWKVAVFQRGAKLCAIGLLMWQCDIMEDGTGLPFDPVLEQVRIVTIEHLAGLCFARHIRRADPISFDVANAPGVVTTSADLCVP